MTTTTQYKNTFIGLIPKEWEVKTFGEVVKIEGGSQPPLKNFIYEPREGYIRLIQTRDYRTDKYITYIPFEFAKKFCKKDDIIIGRYGPPIFQIFKGLEGAYNVALMKAIPNLDIVDKDFTYYFISRPELRSYLEGLSQRSGGQTGVEIDKLNKYPFPLPPLPEQQKIAEVLSAWDKAIQDTDAIIKKLEQRNKALANKLITFKNKSNQQKIKAVVDRIKKSFIPIKDEKYTQIGIRSHAKGIFYKEPVTGKELGNKSVFWIEPNCFIVNIVFAWEQAVAKTTDKEVGYIASHRFPMYKPKQGVLDLDYLLYQFKTSKGKDLLEFASPGGAGRNKTLGQSNFLDLNIPVPPIEEQRNAVEVLNTANHELKQYQEKLEVLKLQKKGLMQQLLTGKIRTV